MQIVWRFLLHGLPLCFLLLFAALSLFGIRSRITTFLCWGLCLGAVAFAARVFLYELGFDKMAVVICLIPILRYGYKISLQMAILGCFFSYLLFLLGELILQAVIGWCNFDSAHIAQDLWLNVGLNWLSSMLLILVPLIFYGSKYCLLGLREQTSARTRTPK